MNFPLISTLQKTKGASLFTIDVWVRRFDQKLETVPILPRIAINDALSPHFQNQAEKSLTHNASYMVRLCVAVKRKLQLFYWKNTGFLELGEDIVVSDVPKSIALCRQSICVGFRNEYVLIKVRFNGACLFITFGYRRQINFLRFISVG
jgi:hypothetical protein